MTENYDKTGERDGVARYVHKANLLEVLVKEDRSAPVVTFLVLYRVGSRNEAVGYTGATHLLEHLLFKGTPTFNRANGTQIAAQLERIGADFNATTWYDRTKYFETVPSDQLEFAVRLEADRMRNSFVAEEDRQSEMTVVRNELELMDNDPHSVLEVQIMAAAYREHPYHHPTIGWRADVEGVPIERLRAFYDTFYWPNNATVVVVGDVDTDDALALVDTYFGPIPMSPHPIPQVYTREPEQQGERRIVLRRSGQDGIVVVGFPTPESASPDAAALAVIESILVAGRSSRLYRDLVDAQLASEVNAWAGQFRDPSLFQISARTLPGVTHQQAEDVALAALERLRTEPVPREELEKAKRIVSTQLVFGREGCSAFAERLSEAVSQVDWKWFHEYPDAVANVTVEDVQRVSRVYFRRNRLTAGWFVPSGPPSDADDGFGDVSAVRNPVAYDPGRRRGPEPRRAAPPADASGGDSRPGRDGASFAARTVRSVLDNGVTVVVLERHFDPTVSIRAAVRAGSYYAPVTNRLLTGVTARMLERGTAKRDAMRFAEDIESLGAYVNASASAFTVEVAAHALSRDASTVLDAIAEMLREPSFPAAELEKVKTEVAAAVRRQKESTEDRSFERLTQLVLAPEHPYHRATAEDRLDALATITTDDLRRYHEEHFGGPALTLVVVGDISADDMIADARRLFGDWEGRVPGEIRRELTVPSDAVREFVPVDDKATADVIIGLPGTLVRRDPDYYAARIGNAILGQSTLSSRLGIRVRDLEGLTYGIGSVFYGASLLDGLWYARVSAAPENVEKAIASTLDELRRALDEGVTQSEVDDYVSSFVGSYKVGLATNAGLADRLAEAELFGFGPAYLDAFPDNVRRVTLEEVNAALRRHIPLDKLAIVVAGPAPDEP
jgi:zinc protease